MSSVGSFIGGTLGAVVDPIGSVTSGLLGGSGGILGNITGTNQQSNAAQNASMIQSQSAQAAINEQKRQFDAIVQMMQPYLQAGQGAIGQQQNLLGLGGANAQQEALKQLQQGPLYQTMLNQGENRLLQNASATGGLRGGNTQAALAQLAPQILSNVYQQQLANLGGLSQLGQSSAGLQSGAGQSMANNIGTLLGQQGSALAGGQLASGSTQAKNFNNILNLASLASAFI